MFCFVCTNKEEKKSVIISHKSTQMSNISCEKEKKKTDKTQDNEIKDLKNKKRRKFLALVLVFFPGNDRCIMCTGRKTEKKKKTNCTTSTVFFVVSFSFLFMNF
jgi:hypothetical protein